MKSIQDRIEEIQKNGYQLDFGTVFENAFENYKKIALYAGLMLLVSTFLISIILLTGVIAYIGIENLEAFGETLKRYSTIKILPLEIALPLHIGLILFSGLINPFMAGFFKMADCGQKDEEFHVSTMFTYYRSPYFLSIFVAIVLTTFISTGSSLFFNYVGFEILGSLLSIVISFLIYFTIPLIVFGKMNATEAIKSSVIIVLKQPLLIVGLIIVAGFASIVGLIGLCIGIFFTIPFIYSMSYTLYFSIIGNENDAKM
ncbi:hypothetical protein [Flavobacterium cellulosilyticum]|uniref:Beta-carotene 15,15'-monooxygenase n=1 Tax=Flavobacterium cellulosilyticum TaxID=2541731 RepID=A0A4R5CFI3_9FLAO|nr:hypothetical protein [Flavobacterium cellulosilyticum]TDD95992.1 hypothetical protein E0F76_12850 [Flavobacterium cellulosilyticum]